MIKHLCALIVSCLLAVPAGAQSPNSVLSQLGASGVTSTGGTTNHANYLVKLGADGKLNAAMMPSSSSSIYALDRIRVVDSVNGLDSTNRNGSFVQPFRTIQYALTNGTPVAPVLFLAPGQYGTITVDTGLYPGLTNLTLVGLSPGVELASLRYLAAGTVWDAQVTLQNLTVTSALRQYDNRLLTADLREHTAIGTLTVGTTNGIITIDPTATVSGYSSSGGSFTVTPAAAASRISYGTNTVSGALDSILLELPALATTNWVISYAYPGSNPSNYISTNQLGYLTNMFVGTNWVIGYAYPVGNPSNYIGIVQAAVLTNGLVSTNAMTAYAYPLVGNVSNFVTWAELQGWTNSGTVELSTYMTYAGGTGTLVNIYTQSLTLAGASNGLDGLYGYDGSVFTQAVGVGSVLSVPPWTVSDNGSPAYTNTHLGVMFGINGYPGSCTATVTIATNILPMASLGQVSNMINQSLVTVTQQLDSLSHMTDNFTSMVFSNPSAFYPMTGNPSGYVDFTEAVLTGDVTSIVKSNPSAFYPMTGNPSNFLTTATVGLDAYVRTNGDGGGVTNVNARLLDGLTVAAILSSTGAFPVITAPTVFTQGLVIDGVLIDQVEVITNTSSQDATLGTLTVSNIILGGHGYTDWPMRAAIRNDSTFNNVALAGGTPTVTFKTNMVYHVYDIVNDTTERVTTTGTSVYVHFNRNNLTNTVAVQDSTNYVAVAGRTAYLHLDTNLVNSLISAVTVFGSSNGVWTSNRTTYVSFDTNALTGVVAQATNVNTAYASEGNVYVGFNTNVIGAVTNLYGATNTAYLSNNTTYVEFNTNVVGGLTNLYGNTNAAYSSNNNFYVAFNTNVVGGLTNLYGATNQAYSSNNNFYVEFNTNVMGGVTNLYGASDAAYLSNNTTYVQFSTNTTVSGTNWSQYAAQTNVNMAGYTLYNVGGLSFTGDLAIGFTVFQDTNTVPAPASSNTWTVFAARVNGTNYLMAVDSLTNRTYIGNSP